MSGGNREVDGSGWRWSPGLGRWQPDYGLPDVPAPVSLSTAPVPVLQRSDFWRNLVYYHFDADRAIEPGFRAEAIGAASQRIELYAYRSDAVSGRRTLRNVAEDGGDCLSIGFVLAGERRSEALGDARVTATRGMAFVYDAARPSTVAWSRHRGLHLMLRRVDFTAMLGGDVPAPSLLAARLDASPVAALLRDTCRTTAQHLATLPAGARVVAFEQLHRLLRLAVVQVKGARPAEPRSARQDVYVAAVALMERHLASSTLGVGVLCRALGVSRATLYRAFADQCTSVAALRDEMRLDTAWHKLRATPSGVTIADIAADCGLYDSANFSRRFKMRFGRRPSEVREGD